MNYYRKPPKISIGIKRLRLSGTNLAPYSKATHFLVVLTWSFASSARMGYSGHFACPISQDVTGHCMRYVHSTVLSIPAATSEDGDGVRTPYMLLDWICGTMLECNAIFPPPDARGKVLVRLAQYTRTCWRARLCMMRTMGSRLTCTFTGDL